MRSIENTGIDLTEIGVADETTIEFIRKYDLLRIEGYNVGAARNLLRKIGFENLPYNFCHCVKIFFRLQSIINPVELFLP